jgi:hypothetical protein
LCWALECCTVSLGTGPRHPESLWTRCGPCVVSILCPLPCPAVCRPAGRPIRSGPVGHGAAPQPRRAQLRRRRGAAAQRRRSRGGGERMVGRHGATHCGPVAAAAARLGLSGRWRCECGSLEARCRGRRRVRLSSGGCLAALRDRNGVRGGSGCQPLRLRGLAVPTAAHPAAVRDRGRSSRPDRQRRCRSAAALHSGAPSRCLPAQRGGLPRRTASRRVVRGTCLPCGCRYLVVCRNTCLLDLTPPPAVSSAFPCTPSRLRLPPCPSLPATP